jgi:hypothetical protein
MQISIVHGPDRLAVAPGSANVPFHGIVSRGLVDRMTPSEWVEVAPRIEATAWGAETLSYSDSAAIATAYIDEHAGGVLDTLGHRHAVRRWELWSCKEGHTASIWCASGFPANGAPPVRFCLNIARDQAAAAELKATADILVAAGERNPSGVVRVLDCRHMPGPRTERVPVITTNWIDGWELHALPNAQAREEGRLVAVARFLFSDGNPVRTARVAAFAVEPRRGWARILHHWIRCCDWNRGDGLVAMPIFEIQEGDWMLSHEDTILCAASAEICLVAPGEAVLACFLIHANLPDRRTHWGNVADIQAVLAENQASVGPLLARGLGTVASPDRAALTQHGLLTDSRSEEIVWAAQRLLGGA